MSILIQENCEDFVVVGSKSCFLFIVISDKDDKKQVDDVSGESEHDTSFEEYSQAVEEM